MERLIIGFCGGTGSGKTTLAERVIKAVGGDGVLVSMDCYYTDHKDMPFEERAAINYDHPNAFDTDLLISHLKDLKIGVMGCIVNGPGEMADADYGYVGAAAGKITLYKGREVVCRNIPQEQALDRLIEIIKENGDWTEC